MLWKLEEKEAESCKELTPLGVRKDLELKGIKHKRKTWWAQIYDRSDNKFYLLFINEDNYFKHKGKRISIDDFDRKKNRRAES